jgi:hypothetical protein
MLAMRHPMSARTTRVKLRELSPASAPRVEPHGREGRHPTFSGGSRRTAGTGSFVFKKPVVGAIGIEPMTSAMSTQRSYQLSYAPLARTRQA